MALTTKKIACISGDTSSLDVYHKNIASKECLFFKYTGFVSIDTIQSIYTELKGINLASKDHNVVVDCSEVTDYDCESRNLLQDILQEAKEKIKCLWVVTESLTIHAALEILSFFTLTEIKVVKNLYQLEKRLYLN